MRIIPFGGYSCDSGKRQGDPHCWRLCRQKVTVQALTPFDRNAPTGNCGTPRTGNASVFFFAVA